MNKTLVSVILLSWVACGFSVAEDKQTQDGNDNGGALLPPRFVEFIKLDREKKVLHIAEFDTRPARAKALPLPKEIKELFVQTLYAVRIEHLHFVLADGTTIDVDAAAKRLSRGAVILLSPSGRMIDGRYRRLLKEDVLILVIAAKDIPHPPALDIDTQFTLSPSAIRPK